jgi:hypothetical protein
VKQIVPEHGPLAGGKVSADLPRAKQHQRNRQ